MKQKNEKLTLQEYIDNYSSKPYNSKQIKRIINIVKLVIALVLITCLFLVCLNLYKLNEYVGYISIVIAIIIFIFLFIIPVCKINSNKQFKLNVNTMTAREAKRYNAELRNELADKILDLAANASEDDITIYQDKNLKDLALAKHSKDQERLKEVLANIYNTDIKKETNQIIKRHALQVGITTAISQSDKIDTAFMLISEINLIKQIIFIYGYRPTDNQLLKIYKAVVMNSLITYGASKASSDLVSGIATKLSSSIPVLGNLVETIVGSASQGVINAGLTIIIGFQTRRYLIKEYHLQDVLDNIEFSVEDEEAEKIMIDEIKKELTKKDK